MASMQAAPIELNNTLARHADAINLPSVGCEGNYAFPSVQLNIAATKTAAAPQRTFVLYG